MNKWLVLHPKFKAAFSLAVVSDAGAALAAYNGTGTWHEVGAAVIASVIALVGVYFGNAS